MRHRRNEGTKVWHNPEIAGTARRSLQNGASTGSIAATEKRDETRHRAALEALFAPRKDPAAESDGASVGAPRAKEANGKDTKPSARIVLTSSPDSDPAAVLRQRLLSKLLASESRPSVSKAATDFLKAGFSFPDEQDVHLKLLEHADERVVCSSIDALAALLTGEVPKRRTVLESRLRRIEEFAEEGPTRKKAEDLRRIVAGRSSSAC
jgi:hypothetical protein